MSDTEMNLLPEELRKAESRELKRPVPPPPRPGYTTPASQFEERLRDMSAPRQSLFGKIASWFRTVPPPSGAAPDTVVTPSRPLPTIPQVRRAPAPTLPDVGARPAAAPPARSVPVAPASSSVTPPVSPRPPKPAPPPIPLGILLDVNLLPTDGQPKPGGERPGLRLAAVAGALVFLVAIGYAVLTSLVVSRTNRLATVERQAEQLHQEVVALKQGIDEAELAGHKMQGIKALLAERPDWIKFFSKIEALTLPTVTYSTMAVEASGDIRLSAEAATMTELAKQLLVFERATDTVASVNMAAVALAESEGNRGALARTSFQLKLVPGWLASTAAATNP